MRIWWRFICIYFPEFGKGSLVTNDWLQRTEKNFTIEEYVPRQKVKKKLKSKTQKKKKKGLKGKERYVL